MLGGCESLSAVLNQGGAVVGGADALCRGARLTLKIKVLPVDPGSVVSQHDAALLISFYEALNVSDVDAVLDLCGREVEVYMPPEVVAAVAPRGHRDVGEYLRGWFDSWHVYRPEPEDFISAGHQVVALVHLRARGKGSRFEIEEDVADVFEFEGGKISKLRLYVPRDTALEQSQAG